MSNQRDGHESVNQISSLTNELAINPLATNRSFSTLVTIDHS